MATWLSAIIRWTSSTAIAALVAFVIVRAQQGKVELSGLKVLSSSPSSSQLISARSLNSLPLHDIHRSAVVDSVVGIVESYYVDHQRLSPSKLLDETLRILKEKGILERVEWFPTTGSNPGKIRAWINNQSVVLGSVLTYSNSDLTSDLAALTDLVERGLTRNDSTYQSDYLAPARIVGNAFLNSLDPHSNLLSSEEYQDLRQGTEGSFGGLGIVVGVEDDLLTVMKPIPGSPAALAGIGRHDKIISIDDVLTFGVSLEDLVQHMRGLPGTKVNLSILKPDNELPSDIEIERAVIDVPSVSVKMLHVKNLSIAHITIESFSSKTSQELETIYANIRHKGNLDGIILDLRSNPGGLLDQAVEVADFFLESGDIVSTRGRKYSIDKAHKSPNDATEPVIVLINNQTASASEIVAAALQENNRALVLGEPSFGKGSVQTIFELPADNALKLTIARYYTPNGRSIQGLGVYPDLWLQPIENKNENENLFGDYRFVTESSLFHALPVSSNRDDLGSRKSKYKAYYLKNDEKIDIAVDVAGSLIEDFTEKNGRPVPPERNRRSYLLASSSEFISKRLRDKNREVLAHLKNVFGIDWSDKKGNNDITNQKIIAKSIDFHLTSVSPNKVTYNGDDYSLSWSIYNPTDESLDRISVYVIESNQEVSPKEILIGSIPGKSRKKGTIKVPIKISDSIRKLSFKVGLSIDAEPAVEFVRELSVDISNKKSPDIAYEVRLIEDGGLVPEVFEPGEQGYFLVSIENHSDFSVSDMKFGFVNLSGYQVDLDRSHYNSKFNLGKFEKKIFKVPVSASTEIYSNKLIFGLVISGNELPNPIKGNFAVKSK